MNNSPGERRSPLGLFPGQGAPRLYDRVVETLRARHHSVRSRQTYCHRAKRLIHFNNLRHSAEMAEPEIDTCLTHLAVKEKVSASTQNQALSALQYFDLALKNDPNSARAYVGIALVWGGRMQMGSASPAEADPKLRDAARKALELDPTLPEAHFVLALRKYDRDWDWAGSELEFKKVLELNPNYADAHAYYAHMLAITGREQEALSQMERALELDPLNGLYRSLYGAFLTWNHRYDDAIAQCQLSLKTTPGNPIAYGVMSNAYFRKGAYKEALDAAVMWARSGSLRKSGVDRILEKGYAEGGYQVAMRRAADALVALSHKSHVSPNTIADFYVRAGDHQKALDWLEKGFEARDPGTPNIAHAAHFDSLRSEPRFQALVRRLNLPQ